MKLLWLALAVLVVFSGLCTIFVSAVTAVQAWQEHAQAKWLEVTAHVDTCALRQNSSSPKRYYISCRLAYTVGAEQNIARVYSSNVPPPNVWQSPPNQIAPLEEWVGQHPPGTPILMRYNPAYHSKAVMASDYLPPLGGPHTPHNIKLLEVCAGSFLVLLALARITRPRSLGQMESSSIPINP